MLSSSGEETEEFELSIFLADINEMQELNLKYRGIDSPTDVLSFAMREGGFNPNNFVLGDIVICPPVVKENAAEDGNPFEKEFIFVLVHGILHLFGFDHINSAEEAKIMNDKSQLILSSLGAENFNLTDLTQNA